MNSFFAGKKVLVTGGAGFIGSHLSEHLIAHGAQVTVLDNLTTGSFGNLALIKDKIRFIEGSVADYQACLEATQKADLVFHLAAFVSVPQSQEAPLSCFETNCTGTANLLEASRKNGVARLIFSSSSAVYGNREGICSEEDPCNPTSPYGLSKLIGEQYCRQYTQIFGLKTVCLRYFNVYGPRQDPQGAYAAVVAKFRYNLRHNLPITIYGDGYQTRDFIPVEKVVEANIKLVQLPQDLLKGTPYNIATGTSISLLELLEQLKKEFPSTKSTILYEKSRPGDIAHSTASSTRYKEALKRGQCAL